MRLSRWIVALAVVTLAPLVQAHEGPRTGSNGGELRDAGRYHLELVVKGGKVTLYVTDDKDRKVSTRGAAANATVLSGKDRETLKLEPTGENALSGATKLQPAADTKVVVSLTLEGQPSVQARFTPLAAAQPAPKTPAPARK